jgi:hypothetical protein
MGTSDASASERELLVLQKKMFKVLTAIEKRDGGTFWMRVGSAFTNRDNSVNIYLDVLPKNFQFQLRELDEEDLRRRDPQRNGSGESAPSAPSAQSTPSPTTPTDAGGPTDASLPF